MNIKSSGNAWMPAVIMAVVVVIIGGVFVMKWSPSKTDVTNAQTSVTAMQSVVQGYNETVRGLQFKITEHDNKFDTLANNPYISQSDLTTRLTPYVLATDLASFKQDVNNRLNTSPAASSPTGLSLNTTYDGANLVFNVSKVGNITAYFTIVGTVYYNISLFPPVLDSFSQTFSAPGMCEYIMTEYGHTDTGGAKACNFSAPTGDWYYDFGVEVLSVGHVTSGGGGW